MSQDGGLSGAPLADAGLSGGMNSSATSAFITAVTPPLTVSAGNLSMPASSAGSDGYLTQADYSNFSSGSGQGATAFAYVSSIGSPLGDREKYYARAITRLGVRNLAFFFDDLLPCPLNVGVPNGYLSFNGGSGANNGPDATETSAFGIVGASTGTTASSRGGLSSNQQFFVVQTGGFKWWIGCRMKFATAMVAANIGGLALYDSSGSSTINLGYNGFGSTTNFGLQHSGNFAGSFVNSGVAFDNNWHYFEAWGNGTAINVSVDGSAPGTGTASYATMTGWQQLVMTMQNGADTALSRKVWFDWIAAAVVR